MNKTLLAFIYLIIVTITLICESKRMNVPTWYIAMYLFIIIAIIAFMIKHLKNRGDKK